MTDTLVSLVISDMMKVNIVDHLSSHDFNTFDDLNPCIYEALQDSISHYVTDIEGLYDITDPVAQIRADQYTEEYCSLVMTMGSEIDFVDNFIYAHPEIPISVIYYNQPGSLMTYELIVPTFRSYSHGFIFYEIEFSVH